MTIVEYFRDFYHERIRLRIAVLTSLKVYQEMQEAERLAQRFWFELLTGHLNGPRGTIKLLLLRCVVRLLCFCDVLVDVEITAAELLMMGGVTNNARDQCKKTSNSENIKYL